MTHSNSFVSSVSSTMRAAVWAAMIVLFSAVMLKTGTVSAQSTALIHHTVVKAHNQPPPAGRDFWFSMMSNYWGEDLGGKYMRIYITSPNNCTAFVSSQYAGGVAGITTPVPVTAFEISSYKIPEFWEMESSGIPENKAIHVYSNTADLTVYDMSHNPYTSDGSYIIPTIGWGTDYVVAAYGALFEGGGSYVYDLPSTCVVTANQDNTTFEITPSCNLRQCTSGNDNGDANSTIIVFPQGQPQTFQLNKGQCMQFMPIKAQDPDNYDMTGTIIHSNVPVGVSGGSVCPNIPADFPYCDHVEDMIPPVRAWAETYYTNSPIQPPGETNKDFARYLFIGTQPGQIIWRYNETTGTQQECVIDNQYGFYWDELELGERVSSSAPFLCVWYLNSATYPDGDNGLGDPAECVINPKEQYTKTVVFETPISVGNIVPYDDYANVVVNTKDEDKTLFDQKNISGYPHVNIDSNWAIFNFPHIAPAVHEVTNDDSGVGVYIYGYGYDESYAWTGSFGTGTFHSPDTIPPVVDTIGQCLTALIHVTDSGLLPGPAPQQPQSGLSEIRVDSIFNMNYTVDPNWQEGSAADTSCYTISVVNSSLPAYILVEVFDEAGNEDSIWSVYEPQIDSIKPPIQNLGVWIAPGNPPGPNIAFDTLYNTGKTVFDISELQLLKGNVGFTIFDSIGGPLDLTPLKPGQRRLIEIKFEAKQPTPVIDSILFGNACFEQAVALIGSGGADDFLVTSQKWLNEPLGSGYVKTVTIENLSSDSIVINSASWPDPHFVIVPGSQLPITIPKSPGNRPITITYTPDIGSLTVPNTTQGTWLSKNVLEADGITPSPRFDSLYGNAVAPSETFVEDTVINDLCPSPGDTVTAYFTITETGTTGGVITKVVQSDPTDFFNLLGTLNNTQTWNPATTPQSLSVGQSATISVQYVVPPGLNKTVVDNLIAINVEGDTIGGTALSVTVNGIYYAGATEPTTLSFGPVPYQSQNTNATQKSFLVTNESTTSTLAVNSIGLQPGNNNSAFTISFANQTGQAVSLPDTLPVGQSLVVNVDFNDSLYNVPNIQALFSIQTNSCPTINEMLTAAVTHPTPNVYSYAAPPILSCDNQTDSGGITNSGAWTDSTNNSFNASVTVVSEKWSNGANFSTSLPVGYVLNGSTNFTAPTATNGTPNLQPVTGAVPITFTPNPQSAIVTYYDTLMLTMVNSDGDTVTEAIPVVGVAGGATVSATTAMVNQTHSPDGTSGVVGDAMTMPASFSVAIPSILSSSVTPSTLAITGVTLTYTVPDRDLLTLTGTPTQQFNAIAPWSLVNPGPNNPLVTPGAGTSETITVTLTGGPLTATTGSFGTFDFQADLDTGTRSMPVTLQSMQLFTGANGTTPVGACIDTTVQGTNFSLILACGDSTLSTVMQGQGSLIQFVGSATPDPVTGGSVTMKYANLGASTMTLAIYDALGNEVAKPVDNVYQAAGAWQVTADVSKLPSGTYTYRLSGSSATGPMAVSNQFVIQR